jgi:hypothetical protein
VTILIDLSKYSEEHIDSIILDYYNEWCVLPEWSKDTKSDILLLPPKIIWYPENSAKDVNNQITCCGVTAKAFCPKYDPDDNMHGCMNEIVYLKYFKNTLIDIVMRTCFFRVGLLNTAAQRGWSLEETVQGIVRHEWRHVLQNMYLDKVDFHTHGNKINDMYMSYAYNSPESIKEEDAREVQYTNPNKPIEDFYKEYKRYEYVYLKRTIRRPGKSDLNIILED